MHAKKSILWPYFVGDRAITIHQADIQNMHAELLKTNNVHKDNIKVKNWIKTLL